MAELTPAGWLQALERKLDDQARYAQSRCDYYDGRHRLAFATQKFKEAFARFFPPMANNWCQIVVDAAVERLEVQGFRFGDTDPDAAAWDVEGDEDAWAIWQANNLDALSVMAHTEAVKCGKAYTMVEPNGDTPTITIEHPTQVVVATAPGNRRTRLAALKRWIDEDGYAYANVYLDDEILKWRSQHKMKTRSGSRIDWRGIEGGRNPLGVVPIVPLENTPDLMTPGRSDLDCAIPIQDAVNKLCLDMQVSSEFHAYPQRWATGWEVPKDPDDPTKVDPAAALKASQAAIWASQHADTEFGQLSPGDVANYIKPIEMYVRHLAAQTRTPPHYLLGEIVNASGDALKAAETGLTFRVKRKQLDFSDGWEETMRLAFKANNDERADDMQAEALWGDPESKSIAQLVDAAVKMRESLSVPLEMCWQMLGFTPRQIKQAKKHMNLPDSPPPQAAAARDAARNGQGNSGSVVLPAGVTP